MLAEILNRNRSVRPMVHCMVNLVTANDCANLVLASGASPIMAEDAGEVEEVTAFCDGLVLNLGTPSPRKIEALLRAGREANRLGHPVVFDPVGAGSSQLRKEASRRILREVKLSVIRGNASEIRTLAEGTMARRGVDVDDTLPIQGTDLARELARRTGAVVVLSGDVDTVTDGMTVYRVKNGHPMMRSVTGTGCQLSCLTGAYAAANPDQPLQAALAAVCAMGLCGEIAFARLSGQEGNATYRNYIIDALYHLRGTDLERGANYAI